MTSSPAFPTAPAAETVVCVGLTVLDVVHRVTGRTVWGRKHVADATDVTAGGPAANAAVCAAALHGGATLVTGLGDGIPARAARAELERYGVRVVDLAPPGWELPVASCVVDDSGERTVWSTGALDTDWRLDIAAREAVRRARVVLLDGHHPGAAEEALTVALDEGDRGPITVLDAGSAKPHAEPWLARLDVVAGSADYAAGLGLTLEEAARHVLAAGAGSAVMTDGPRPVRLHRAGWVGGEWVTPPAVTAVDSLGAGDAFHGALAVALATGRDLVAAVRFACAVAAARVAQVGAREWWHALPPL